MRRFVILGVALSISGFVHIVKSEDQTCNDKMNASTATSAFTIDSATGTVTHLKTKLVWKLCAEGQTYNDSKCEGTASTYTWQKALEQVQTVNSGGGFATQADWRLPNIKELATLVELRCVNPAMNTEVFPQFNNGFYWSATPHGVNTGESWSIDFDTGADKGRSRVDTSQVRLVRGGGL